MKITIKSVGDEARFKKSLMLVFAAIHGKSSIVWGTAVFIILMLIALYRNFIDIPFWAYVPIVAFCCFIIFPFYIWLDYWKQVRKFIVQDQEKQTAELTFDDKTMYLKWPDGREFTGPVSRIQGFIKTHDKIILLSANNLCADMLSSEFPDEKTFADFPAYLISQGVKNYTRKTPHVWGWFWRITLALILIAVFAFGVIHYDYCGGNIKKTTEFFDKAPQ